MKLKINEAIAYANARGNLIRKKDLAKRIFPDATESSMIQNMSNLCAGRTKRIAPEWIVTICKMCDCSANFLFGMSDETNS